MTAEQRYWKLVREVGPRQPLGRAIDPEPAATPGRALGPTLTVARFAKRPRAAGTLRTGVGAALVASFRRCPRLGRSLEYPTPPVAMLRTPSSLLGRIVGL